MENNIAIHERIASLETQREEDSKMLQDILKKVNKLHDDMTRYKGFLGAVTFLGSSLVVLLGFTKDWFFSHWK